MKTKNCRYSDYLSGRMAQNLIFSAKKAHFWLVPVLAIAGLFSWAHVQEGGQPQPVKTELVVLASKTKGAKWFWYTTAKRFNPLVTSFTEVYTARTIQIRWGNQLKIYSEIKASITFASCCYWKSRSLTSIVLG
jgi:hypothetical protein